MNRNVTVIKIGTTFQLTQFLLPQLKQAFDNEKIYLSTWSQLYDFLPRYKFSTAKKLITNQFCIGNGIFF